MGVWHDKKRERWRVEQSYQTPDGKWHRISKIIHRYCDVMRAQGELNREIANILHDGAGMTIDDLWNEYYEQAVNIRRLTSIQTYRRLYLKYIKPTLGDKTPKDLTVSVIREWKNVTIDPSFSLRFKRQNYAVLHMLLTFGSRVHPDIVSLTNINTVGTYQEDPNKVSEKVKKLHYWTEDQFELFSAKLREYAMEVPETSPDYMVRWSTYVFYNVLFYSGLRRGEANALMLEDYHMEPRPYLDVTKSVTGKAEGVRWQVTDPKNKPSIREAPIPQKLVAILDEHIDRLARIDGFKVSTCHLIGGLHYLNDSTADRIKEQVTAECKLPHIRTHDFRHSFASVLINNGVPMEMLSRLMGHGSIAETEKVYTHMYPKTLSTAVNVFDRK